MKKHYYVVIDWLMDFDDETHRSEFIAHSSSVLVRKNVKNQLKKYIKLVYGDESYTVIDITIGRVKQGFIKDRIIKRRN